MVVVLHAVWQCSVLSGHGTIAWQRSRLVRPQQVPRSVARYPWSQRHDLSGSSRWSRGPRDRRRSSSV